MIVVRLMGGMGNQMFQYAAARALERRIDTELCFDLSYLGGTGPGTIRHFELNHFRCAGRVLSKLESLRFGSLAGASLLRRGLARATRFVLPANFYQEPEIAFDAAVRCLPNNTVLTGRFQSYRYFEEIVSIVRSDFRLATSLSPQGSALAGRARNSQSVALHVRRGDYVNNEFYKEIIHALPVDYYRESLRLVKTKLGTNISVFVISDDISWCKKQEFLQLADVFVDLSETALPNIEEFEVMRNCRHHVISNSTFAWWAAWLSPYTQKLTIAPKVWSHIPRFSGRDRLPLDWVAI